MLYEVTAFGTYFNQQVINRWNYVSDSSPSGILGSFALATAFGAVAGTPVPPFPAGTVARTMMDAVSASFQLSSITVRAAGEYDPTDFYEAAYAVSAVGAQLGQPMSPTAAYGLRTNVVRTDIRRGTKRFVGVTEDNVDAGGIITSDQIDNLKDVADAMTDVLSYTALGSTILFTPCVVSKERYETPSGRFAYRYYASLSVQLEHVALSPVWQVYGEVRTQTSRQYGRGA